MREVEKVLNMFNFQFTGNSGCLGVMEERQEELNLPITINGGILKVIGHKAFMGRHLGRLNLPVTLEAIEALAFSFNELTTVKLPRNIRFIGERAFSNNPLQEIVLPPSLEYIDDAAFENTTKDIAIICQEDSYACDYALLKGYSVEVLTKEEMDELYNPDEKISN